MFQSPGPFVNCHLRLDTKKDFYPGDEVKGQLVIAPTEIVYCHGIYLALEGKAVVSYKVMGEAKSKEEKVVKEECYVLGKNIPHAGVKKMQLPVHPQEFPFCLKFPGNVPSSFHGKFGIIEYQLLVYLIRSDTYHVKQIERTLNVMGTLDLQEEYPHSLEAVKFTPPSKKKPFKATLQLDKSGYLPGEKMTYTIELFNPENVVVEDITLTFVKKVIYKVREKETKSAKATLAVLNKSSMDQVTPFVYTGTVTVPPDLYPTQFGRPIETIDLQYAMQIVVGSPETTLAKGEMPIIIGCHARPQGGGANHNNNNSVNRAPLSQQNSSDDLIKRSSTAGGGNNTNTPSCPMDGGRKMESHVTDSSRRGSASDLPDMGAAFSLLSFIPKSTSMEALRRDEGEGKAAKEF